MDAFTIEIANLVAQVRPLYETTAVYCKKYMTDKQPTFQITVTEDDIHFEQHMLDIEAREEGMKLRKFTSPFLERAAIQRKIAEQLLHHNTFLLHGSTIAVDGEAYLFTAACGTGKSTHTRLWREVFADRAVMINDDKPFLQVTNHGVIAHGSPWSGKHGLDSNIHAPLRGICILNRGKENVIRRICAEDAISMLRHQSYVSVDASSQQLVHDLLDQLLHHVPLWEMYCTKDREAALVAFQAMSDISNTKPEW